MEAKVRRLHSGITLGVILIMAFILVQPTMQQANAVGIEGLPGYDNCGTKEDAFELSPEEPISMNTVRSGNIVKTVHAEKEIHECLLNQGELPVTVDVTTYIEIYENIVDREVIATNVLVTTCLKEPAFKSSGGATVIDCESYTPSSDPIPVGSTCHDHTDITHPQEMNTVNKGNIAKTIEAQKEVFHCDLNEFQKKVDVVIFTDIYENLTTQDVLEVQFHVMRCVVLLKDNSDDLRDATVETCQFSSIEN